jgi:hypothetical protein
MGGCGLPRCEWVGGLFLSKGQGPSDSPDKRGYRKSGLQYLAMRRKFRVGDKAKVVGMSPVTFAPGVKDELGTEKLFKSMLGRSTPFKDSTDMET